MLPVAQTPQTSICFFPETNQHQWKQFCEQIRFSRLTNNHQWSWIFNYLQWALRNCVSLLLWIRSQSERSLTFIFLNCDFRFITFTHCFVANTGGGGGGRSSSSSRSSVVVVVVVVVVVSHTISCCYPQSNKSEILCGKYNIFGETSDKQIK